jgi:CHAT domain-containing protein
MGLMDVQRLQQKLAEVAESNLRRKAGEPRDDLVRRAEALEGMARRIRLPAGICASRRTHAEVLLALQRDLEAASLLKETLAELKEELQADDRVSLLVPLADAQGRLRQWREVRQTCNEGVRLSEESRRDLHRIFVQSSFLRSRIGLYSWGVRAAYETGDYQSMLRFADLSKCQSALRYQRKPNLKDPGVAQLKREFSKLNREFHANGGTPSEELRRQRERKWDALYAKRHAGGRRREFSLKEIQSVLNADEAILYYYWLNSTDLVIAAMDRAEHRIAIVNSAEYRTEFESYANDVLNFTPGKTCVSPFDSVKDFSRLLLPRELREIFRKKRRLLISPHLLLHSIPLHAMRWERQYLIEKFAVTYVPNLASLLEEYQAPRQERLLAVGICETEVRNKDGEKLSPLNNAEAEAEEAARVFRADKLEARTLRGEEATWKALDELEHSGELGYSSALHFVMHGANIQNDAPMQSHLTLRDGLLDGMEISSWNLHAELIVLSACCSGQRPFEGRSIKRMLPGERLREVGNAEDAATEELRGDELFGLQASFFAAGAKRIVSALWPVDDRVGPLLTRSFHSHRLKNPREPDVALQRSMIGFLKTAGAKDQMVYYWAPLFLAGLGRRASRCNRM